MNSRTAIGEPVLRAPRSWLIAPASDLVSIEQAAASGADAVVVDLVEFVPSNDRSAALATARETIATAAAGGAAIYVQTRPKTMEADLQACVGSGIAGVLLSRAETSEQVLALDRLLAAFDEQRGDGLRPSRIVVALETARGNHAAFQILAASARVAAATLGRVDLVMDLRPEPSGEIRLLPYLMQRLVTLARVTAVLPVGAWWRAPARGLLASSEDTAEAARRGRAIGLNGGMCLCPDQVTALNEAYA